MKRWWLIVAIVVALELAVGAAGFLWFRPALPGAIRKQLSITPLVPRGPAVTIDRGSVTYAPSSQVLTYNTEAFGGRIVVNEQPTPDYFTQTPGAYAELRKAMNEYQQLDTSTGTIYLTRPRDLGGRQIAVLNTAGTLVFARPDFDLSNEQWKRFFGAMVIQQ